MAKTFRRVVTGHDENGTAIVVSDAEATHLLERDSRPGVRLTNFWISDGTPAEYDGPEDTCTGEFVLHPPANGSVLMGMSFGNLTQKASCDAARRASMTYRSTNESANSIGLPPVNDQTTIPGFRPSVDPPSPPPTCSTSRRRVATLTSTARDTPTTSRT